MDLQDCWESVTIVQENGQKLSAQHTDHHSRTYLLDDKGQTGSGRYQESKPINNNLFEEDDNIDEVPYHDKMKFQERLKHLSP